LLTDILAPALAEMGKKSRDNWGNGGLTSIGPKLTKVRTGQRVVLFLK
jgi:hypothetical protein